MKRIRRKNKSGMTLVEILVATLIFTIALAALLQSLIAVLDLIEISRSQAIANSDIRSMMEVIRTTAYAQMLTFFPHNDIDGPAGNDYQALIGVYRLDEEHITVTYANVTADPLEINVNVTWQDSKGRNYSSSASTFKTRQ